MHVYKMSKNNQKSILWHVLTLIIICICKVDKEQGNEGFIPIIITIQIHNLINNYREHSCIFKIIDLEEHLDIKNNNNKNKQINTKFHSKQNNCHIHCRLLSSFYVCKLCYSNWPFYQIMQSLEKFFVYTRNLEISCSQVFVIKSTTKVLATKNI